MRGSRTVSAVLLILAGVFLVQSPAIAKSTATTVPIRREARACTVFAPTGGDDHYYVGRKVGTVAATYVPLSDGSTEVTVTVKLRLAPEEQSGTTVRLTEVIMGDPLVVRCEVLASTHVSGTGTKTVVLTGIVPAGTKIVQVNTVADGNTATTDASELFRAP
jgi:hypothetical protein